MPWRTKPCKADRPPVQSPSLSPGRRVLEEEKLALSNKFLKVDKRRVRVSLERYPDLMYRVEASLLAWIGATERRQFWTCSKKIFEW